MSISDAERRAYCKTAHSLFVQSGLTSEQAAGICANIVSESHFNPKAINIDGSKSGKHGVGGGLAGFYYYGAASDLFKFVYGAKGQSILDNLNSRVNPYWNGKPCSGEVKKQLEAAGFSWPISFNDQIRFLISKSKTSGHGGGVRNCSTAKEACIVWEREFERSAKGNGAGRWTENGQWVVAAVNDPNLKFVDDGGSSLSGLDWGMYGGMGGTQPTMVLNTPRNQQLDNILMQTATYCKQQLLCEILESAGILFYQNNTNLKQEQLQNIFKKNETKYLDNFVKPNDLTTTRYINYCDSSGAEMTISEGIVAANICNPFPASGGGYWGGGGGPGYTAFSDNFVASAVQGANAKGDAKGVACALYNYLIANGFKWYEAVGVLCNAHSRMTPEYACIDTGNYKDSSGKTHYGCYGIGFFGWLADNKDSEGDRLLKQAGFGGMSVTANETIQSIMAQRHYTDKDLPHDLFSRKTSDRADLKCRVPYNLQAAAILNNKKLRAKFNEMKAAGFADCAAACLAVNKYTNPSAVKNQINYGQIHKRWAGNSKEICNWLGFKYQCFNNEITVTDSHGSKTYPAGSVVNPSTITSPTLKGSYNGSATWQEGGGIYNYNGTYGGPLPAPYPGQFQPKAGVRNANALWALIGHKPPTINDSLTPVPPKSGAHGTAPPWVEAQMKSIQLPNGEHVRIHSALTQSLTNIIYECMKAGFPIQVDGGYSFRRCNNGKSNQPLSNHGGGGAVDLWASKNDFVHGGHPLSSGDGPNVYRTRNHPVVQIFRKYGWGWGGEYGDYMHFSINDGH